MQASIEEIATAGVEDVKHHGSDSDSDSEDDEEEGLSTTNCSLITH